MDSYTNKRLDQLDKALTDFCIMLQDDKDLKYQKQALNDQIKLFRTAIANLRKDSRKFDWSILYMWIVWTLIWIIKCCSHCIDDHTDDSIFLSEVHRMLDPLKKQLKCR